MKLGSVRELVYRKGHWWLTPISAEVQATIDRMYEAKTWSDLANEALQRADDTEKAAWSTGSAAHYRDADRARAWARFCNAQTRQRT